MTTEAGFNRFGDGEGFIGLAGPYFWREDGENAVEYGFRSELRHGNPNGVLHGGSVSTFVDTVIGCEVMRLTGRRCATINLNLQFVAGARAGDWVSARVTVKKLTRALAFIDGEVMAGDQLIMLASAVFRVFPAEDKVFQFPGGPQFAGTLPS
ncbi:PaaI family thioesterase [Phreatobacter aquaticus]|uniref:PaaI family thioesterase n=1 Tax=Phreatobacter aquaticus TaxID=2570229 RepID=A0A4D7QKA4_9HYPH|nr:PaaI family thioesterase [Phreatobacter aquaticus]QCK88130.1 PaaI family thioesterase [Phreatobacter aquaticus]